MHLLDHTTLVAWCSARLVFHSYPSCQHDWEGSDRQLQHLSDFFMKRSGSLAANVVKKIDMCKSYTWDLVLIIISSCNAPSLANLRRLWVTRPLFQVRLLNLTLPQHHLLAHPHKRNRLCRWRCSLLTDKRLQQLPHLGEHRSRCFGLRAIF